MPDRNLTDADIDALATVMERRLEQRFYINLGKGLWAAVWRFLIVAALAIAAYGAAKDGLAISVGGKP